MECSSALRLMIAASITGVPCAGAGVGLLLLMVACMVLLPVLCV